jgi:gas vesicle protein
MSGRQNDGGSTIVPFVGGAIVGGIVGAGLALLLAQTEGSIVRDTLASRFQTIGDKALSLLSKATGTADEIIEERLEESERIIAVAREKAEELIRSADEQIAAARERLHAAMKTDENA